MAKKKATFGTLATCKVRYAIVIIFDDNSIKFVTDVLYEPHKECKWEEGKKAYFFDSRTYAEDVCFGLNCHGTGAFVMEVPEYFNEGDFKNMVEEKEGK